MICSIQLLTQLLYLVPIILIVIIFFIIRKINMNKKIFKQLKEFEKKGYKLIKSRNTEYQYVLRTIDKDIYIKVIRVPKYSQVCINAKETWKLSYSYFEKDKGASYPMSRYLTELENFLYNDIKTNREYLKVVYLYKRVDDILMYLNESELDVVDIKKSPYGYKVTTYNSFEKDLDIILDIEN